MNKDILKDFKVISTKITWLIEAARRFIIVFRIYMPQQGKRKKRRKMAYTHYLTVSRIIYLETVYRLFSEILPLKLKNNIFKPTNIISNDNGYRRT